MGISDLAFDQTENIPQIKHFLQICFQLPAINIPGAGRRGKDQYPGLSLSAQYTPPLVIDSTDLSRVFPVAEHYIPLEHPAPDQLAEHPVSSFASSISSPCTLAISLHPHCIAYSIAWIIFTCTDLIYSDHLGSHRPDQHDHSLGFRAAVQDICPGAQMILGDPKITSAQFGSFIDYTYRTPLYILVPSDIWRIRSRMSVVLPQQGGDMIRVWHTCLFFVIYGSRPSAHPRSLHAISGYLRMICIECSLPLSRSMITLPATPTLCPPFDRQKTLPQFVLICIEGVMADIVHCLPHFFFRYDMRI